MAVVCTPNAFWLSRLRVALLALLLGSGLLLQPHQGRAAVNGYGPDRYDAQVTYGQGVYFAPPDLTLYSQPALTAPVVATYQWQADQSPQTVYAAHLQKPVLARSIFLAFYPQLNVAMVPVVGENGQGWVEVVANSATGETAWAPLRSEWAASAQQDLPTHFGVFQTWFEYMKLNARTHGIYWLKGVDHYDKAVRMKPEDSAKLVPLFAIKDMRVLHARGNWLLVEVMDLNRQRPMGWVRWRTDDGKLMVFTNLDGVQRVEVPGMR